MMKPQVNLQENCMPIHHEYEFVRFSLNQEKRRTFEQRCTRKNYGMIFRDLLVVVKLVSTPKYTIRDPR